MSERQPPKRAATMGNIEPEDEVEDIFQEEAATSAEGEDN